jgi:hypothetical protein
MARARWYLKLTFVGIKRRGIFWYEFFVVGMAAECHARIHDDKTAMPVI